MGAATMEAHGHGSCSREERGHLGRWHCMHPRWSYGGRLWPRGGGRVSRRCDGEGTMVARQIVTVEGAWSWFVAMVVLRTAALTVVPCREGRMAATTAAALHRATATETTTCTEENATASSRRRENHRLIFKERKGVPNCRLSVQRFLSVPP
ncbi:carbamoyl-phosphate synthase large subunit [Sesbania bispinosa]|nr:carbamoyl-phosphate synthase large subunit [Sesbania bispinosa]